MSKKIASGLMIIGASMLIWVGFTNTKNEKMVGIGNMQVTGEKKNQINWPPYFGTILLIGGIVITIADKKAGFSKNKY
jgi:uncharacterized membrane protein